MSKLVNIRINEVYNEIHFDWDNERHQVVKVKNFQPIEIELALREAANLISVERIRKEI